jgi:hypothetical protein
MHPTVYHTKKLVKELYQERDLALFCDLHGHSRAHGAFVYGCKSLELPEATKIFPYILSKLSPHFSFPLSRYPFLDHLHSYGIQRAKASTARVSLFQELQHVPAIYTLEASFCGTLDGVFFTPDVLKSIGRDMCRALIPYCGLNATLTMPMSSQPSDVTSLSQQK